MRDIISCYNIIGDNMIDEIEIIIFKNLNEHNYVINYKDKLCTYNDTTRRISEEDIDEIMNHMVLLNKEYGSDNSIDGEEFTIRVNKEVISHGKGIYPEEYLTIKYILNNVSNMNE